jgi:hypothetical protein
MYYKCTMSHVSLSSPFASYICPEYDPFANVSEEQEQARIRKQKLIQRLRFVLANMPRKLSRNTSENMHYVTPKKPVYMYCVSAGVLASGRKGVTFAAGTKSSTDLSTNP